MRWLARVWSRLRWRRTLAPLPLPPGEVVVDLRLVVLASPGGRVTYLLRDPDGRVPDATALSSLFTAVADIGESIDGVHPSVRKACSRLGWAMRERRRLAQAMT